MLFGSKDKTCENCGNSIKSKHNFCPTCGYNLSNSSQEDFGLLGKSDLDNSTESPLANLGITDKLINSVINSMMKSLDKQFKNLPQDFENTEIKTFPNRIKIQINPQKERKQKKVLKIRELDESQLKKMSSLPRSPAKSSIKRIGNKLIYELSTSGVSSPEDIFISKLENGYEIKAIGSKKLYVNTLPVNLPLHSLAVTKDKVFVEFNTQG